MSLVEKSGVLEQALMDAKKNPSKNHMLNVIYASVQAKTGDGPKLVWSEIEELVTKIYGE